MTSIPSCKPMSATSEPIFPNPTTPSVLPSNSCPANCFLLFSIILLISAGVDTVVKVLTKFIPAATPREVKIRAARTSSLTALAFAPGVLNTGIPRSVHAGTGILFTPAPALAIAISVDGTSSGVNRWLLTKMASG